MVSSLEANFELSPKYLPVSYFSYESINNIAEDAVTSCEYSRTLDNGTRPACGMVGISCSPSTLGFTGSFQVLHRVQWIEGSKVAQEQPGESPQPTNAIHEAKRWRLRLSLARRACSRLTFRLRAVRGAIDIDGACSTCVVVRGILPFIHTTSTMVSFLSPVTHAQRSRSRRNPFFSQVTSVR